MAHADSIGPEPPPVRAEPIQPLDCRLLLAADGPDDRQLISCVLKRAGAAVTVVENGEAAVDAVMVTLDRRAKSRNRSENPTAPASHQREFDLVLMDIQMPGMGGYEATRALRRRDYTGPIVAFTANAMPGEQQRCLEAGCSDYVVKPINLAELVDVIRRHVTAKPTAAKVSSDAANAPTADVRGGLHEHDQVLALLAELERGTAAAGQVAAAGELQDLASMIRRSEQVGHVAVRPEVQDLLARLTANVETSKGLDEICEEARKLADLCLAACRRDPRNPQRARTDAGNRE